jgi:translation initiation factor 5B
LALHFLYIYNISLLDESPAPTKVEESTPAPKDEPKEEAVKDDDDDEAGGGVKILSKKEKEKLKKEKEKVCIIRS